MYICIYERAHVHKQSKLLRPQIAITERHKAVYLIIFPFILLALSRRCSMKIVTLCVRCNTRKTRRNKFRFARCACTYFRGTGKKSIFFESFFVHKIMDVRFYFILCRYVAQTQHEKWLLQFGSKIPRRGKMHLKKSEIDRRVLFKSLISTPRFTLCESDSASRRVSAIRIMCLSRDCFVSFILFFFL